MKNGCLICGHMNLVNYLDLGHIALANSYLNISDLGLPEQKFPLRVVYCPNCHLAQLEDIVDRKLVFNDYAYLSSSSPPLVEYFKTYAEDVYSRFPDQANKLVVDIGSNDGTLLKHFQNLGADVLGVDPAEKIAKIATEEGVQTLPEFFSKEVAKNILYSRGSAGLITANHVLAHTDKLNEIISGVKALLAEDGVFVFEVQYLGDLLQKNEFDITYHEHVSYFSLAPLQTLLRNWGLEIFDVQNVEAQGGSLRLFASHAPLSFDISPTIKVLELLEEKQQLKDLITYLNFSNVPENTKESLNSLLKELKAQGKTIVGYGASAKGNTLLQYCEIGTETIDYIVDDTPTKIGKFTSGMHIPILSSEELKKKQPDYILLLAWNYADSIMEKEMWLSETGTKFIIPIPEVRIV